MIKKLTKGQLTQLASVLSREKLLPLKGLRVYFHEVDELHKIDFASEDKSLTITLVSRHNGYDDKAIEKQLKEYFLEVKNESTRRNETRY